MQQVSAGAPQRPLGVRAFDWVGRKLLAASLTFARLDEDGLLARAARRTGLNDFGDARFPEAEARMRRFLAENPRDKHRTHRYSLAFAGLDADRLRPSFADYQRRFEVPSEPGEGREVRG